MAIRGIGLTTNYPCAVSVFPPSGSFHLAIANVNLPIALFRAILLRRFPPREIVELMRRICDLIGQLQCDRRLRYS